MGADGGSIPDRSDMVKTKARSKVTDKDVLREIFFLCALSKVCMPHTLGDEAEMLETAKPACGP